MVSRIAYRKVNLGNIYPLANRYCFDINETRIIFSKIIISKKYFWALRSLRALDNQSTKGGQKTSLPIYFAVVEKCISSLTVVYFDQQKKALHAYCKGIELCSLIA